MELTLKQTITETVNKARLDEIKRFYVVNSEENVVTVLGLPYYKVTYTKYNMSSYDRIVELMVKEKYRIEEEICLTNKGITNSRDTEYVAYRNFVEQCKQTAKAFVNERDALMNSGDSNE